MAVRDTRTVASEQRDEVNATYQYDFTNGEHKENDDDNDDGDLPGAQRALATVGRALAAALSVRLVTRAVAAHCKTATAQCSHA